MMRYLIAALFIFAKYTTHGCVMTSSDQTVYDGEDVYLMCNFTQCSGLSDTSSLNVEWQFQNTSHEPEVIIFQVGNQISKHSSSVCHLENATLWSFGIVLCSVTHKNNGTYVCKLRHNGSFYKNHTRLIVHSATKGRRITPVLMSNVKAHSRWWVTLVSLAGIVLFICAIVLGWKARRQREDITTQNIDENETRSQTADVRNKVTNNSLSVVDMGSQPSTSNADNVYVTMVKNNSIPVGNVACTPNTPKTDNIYVTMHGFPFTTTAPVRPGLSRHLFSDWKPKDEEPVSAHCIQDHLG